MVSITKRMVKGNPYFYLEHSIRRGSKVLKKQKYLGKKIPKDIDVLKKQFIFEVYCKDWFKEFENIKNNYSKELQLMPPSAKKKYLESFLIKFTYNTQRIEGSTLTLKETANLIERGITPKEKPLADVKEAEAHKKAFFEMINIKKSMSLNTVLFWHKTLMKETKADIAGLMRKHGVAIVRSKFIPPLAIEVEFLLREFFEWYKKNEEKLHPIELAALVHLKFVTIHPFSDGNGRISRLMMNYVLHKFNYPMLDIPYGGRTSYYNALERAQVKEEEMMFLQWFFKKYAKENKKFM